MPQRENPTDFSRGSVKKKIQKTNLRRYNPNLTPVDIEKYRQRLEDGSNFKAIFKNNLTEAIDAEVRDKLNRTDKEHHFMAVVYGLTGKGKSTTMLSFILKHHPTFKVDRICFHNQQILDILPDCGSPDFVMRDENVEDSQFGSGSTRVKMQLEAATQTLRKRRISFVFIGVDPFPLSAAQYYFEALDMDESQRITRFGVLDPITRKFLGAYYQKVLPDTHPLIALYNEKKDNFMRSIQEQDYSKGKPKYQEMLDKIWPELDLNIFTTKKERRLFIKQKYSNLTNAELDELAIMLEIQLRNNDFVRDKEPIADAPAQPPTEPQAAETPPNTDGGTPDAEKRP
jgi:hypothetical protein